MIVEPRFMSSAADRWSLTAGSVSPIRETPYVSSCWTRISRSRPESIVGRLVVAEEPEFLKFAVGTDSHRHHVGHVHCVPIALTRSAKEHHLVPIAGEHGLSRLCAHR